MAVTNRYLIAEWIQFLKNNGIVSSAVSADGKITYRRQPTAGNLLKFISYETELEQDEIETIIQDAVRSSKTKTLDVNIWNDYRPGSDNSDIHDYNAASVDEETVKRVIQQVVDTVNSPRRKNIDEITSVMNVIKNTLNDQQRLVLWRLLNG